MVMVEASVNKEQVNYDWPPGMRIFSLSPAAVPQGEIQSADRLNN